MAANSISFVLIILVHIPLARILGVQDYGVFTFLVSWIMIITIFADLGMESVLVKYTPAHFSRGEYDSLRGLFFTSFLTILLLGGIITGIIFVSSDFISNQFDGSISSTHLEIAALAILPILMQKIFTGALQGFKRVLLAVILNNVVRHALMLAIFLSLLHVARNNDASIALWAMLLSYVIVVTTLFSYWIWILPKILVKSQHVILRIKEWFSFSFCMLFIAGLITLMGHIDTAMIGLWLGPEETGIYAISVKFSALITLALAGINTLMAPVISEKYALAKIDELQSLLTKGARFITIATFLIFILVALSVPFILPLYGEEFTRSYIPFLCIAAGQVVNALSGPVAFLMVMTGHHRQAAYLISCILILNILGNALMIPIAGIIGAAVVTGVSLSIWNLSLLIYVRRRLKLNPCLIRMPVQSNQ